MGKKFMHWLFFNQDIFVVNFILLFKVLIFTLIYKTSQASLWLILSTLAILFIVSSCIALLPAILRQCALLFLDMFITLLLITDSMFERFFHRILPVPALFQTDQLSGISKSIVHVVSISDLLLAGDLFIIVPFLAYMYLQQKYNRIKWRTKALQTCLTIFICFGLVVFEIGDVRIANGNEAVSDIYSNNALLNRMGVLSFHVADAYNTFAVKPKSKLSQSDIVTLKGWNAVHQSIQKNLQGAAKGKNLIIVQMESLQNFLIGQSLNGKEITPNLNKLMNNSMYFDNYFVQVSQGNSSDAEFMTFNSLYPIPVGVSFLKYPNNNFDALPQLLKGKGYSTSVTHGDVSTFWGRDIIYPRMGIDKFFSRDELKSETLIGMGLSDETVFKQSVNIIEQQTRPFMSMVISLSGHHPFEIPKSEQELNIPTGLYSKLFSDYLQSQHYADKQLGLFIDQLEKDGILDNSVLVVYGDHFGSGWDDSDLKNFTGINDLNELQQIELKKVPLFIRMPNGENKGIMHQSGGQMDLMPTLVNLFGLDKQKTFCFGQDLLNERDGWTIFRYYAPDGSFATDDYMYIGNWDGDYTHGHAYDRKTGHEINVDDIKDRYNEAKKQLQLSDHLLDSDSILDIVANK